MDLVYGLLPADLPQWLRVFLSGIVPAVLLVTFMALGPILYVYAERKIAGFMQDRLGPTRVGPYGLLQTVADAIKLMFKEAIYPRGVDKKLFLIAPCLVVLGAFLGFVVVPFGSGLMTADLNVGVFYVVAVSSLSTVGLIMAGWASNNKYALFGAMRSAAQIVSYEIPAVMSLLAVVMIVGSLSLQDIVWAQEGGLGHWLLFKYFPLMPIAFVIFFTAGLAECNRTPFDIPEAESELVAGFHTEYSGFFFAMFFMAEYTEMFIFSAVASVAFLGGWWAPHPLLQQIGPIGLGPLWLIAQGLGSRLHHDVAALDAAAAARRSAHVRRVEGPVAHRDDAGRGGGGPAHLGADEQRLPVGPLRGMDRRSPAPRLPRLHDAGGAAPPRPDGSW